MIRPKSDRRVQQIMAAVERVIASPRAISDGLIDGALCKFLSWGCNCGDLDGDGWSPESLREIVLALALHAPPGPFRELVHVAKRQREFVEYWDKRGWIESMYAAGPERDAALFAHGAKSRKAA